MADYGRGQPCKPGERADTTGCIPSKAEPSGAGAPEEVEAIRIEALAKRADLATVVMDDVLGKVAGGGTLTDQDRGEAEKALTALGMDRQQAQGWLDDVAGKPRAAARAQRLAVNYLTGIREAVSANFDRFVDAQVRAGVNPRLARGVALAGAVLAGSPFSVTTVLAPVIGAWGATPGLGQVEGLTLVGAFAVGGRAVRAWRNLAGRGGLMATAPNADGFDPIAWAKAATARRPDDEGDAAAFDVALVLLAMGGTADPARAASAARQAVNEATDIEKVDLASGLAE